MAIFNLLSSPRNISTPLMYSFAQRKDTQVLDEPFYAYYLKRSGAEHPGRDLILKKYATEPDVIFDEINALHSLSKNLFIKNVAHHLDGIDWKRFLPVLNIIFIRDPALVLRSYHAIRTIKDIGIVDQYELYKYLFENGNHPIVLDAESLEANPEGAIKKLCEFLELDFDSGMMNWEPGAKQYDGCWAHWWYALAHSSTGFIEKKSHGYVEVEKELEDVYNQALPLYLKLKAKAIQV